MNDPQPSEVPRSPELLSSDRSVLLVVDLQEKLTPVIAGGTHVIESSCFLIQVARVMEVPTLISEQYPTGLGPTVPPLLDVADDARMFEKLRFSAAAGFMHQVRGDTRLQSRRQIILAGIEAHICVAQTALDLMALGYHVSVARDAIGSRHDIDLVTAERRLRDSGVSLTTAESIAFEWCEVAGTEAFRKVSRLVRDREAGRRASETPAEASV
jgi:nicotinamidase-related amidase